MKKLFSFLAIAALLLMGTTAWAASFTANFSWTQSGTVAGWKLYQGTTAGGESATAVADIPFTTSQSSYSYSMPITYPDGAKTTYYWVLKAYTASGVLSAASNEVSAMKDLTVPPTPGGFTVTVQ